MAEEYAKINHLYNKVLPKMHRLRVTEDGKYALWLDERGKPSVIWAFADTEIPAHQHHAWRNANDGTPAPCAKKRITVKKGNVYSV